MSHFNKNPSAVALRRECDFWKKRQEHKAAIAPHSPSPSKPLPFSWYHKRDFHLQCCGEQLQPISHFAMLLPPHPTFTAASCCPSTYLRTRREQRVRRRSRGGRVTTGGGQESRFFFQAAGLFQSSVKKHIVCFMRQTRPRTQTNIY